jgi:hypothetical protein
MHTFRAVPAFSFIIALFVGAGGPAGPARAHAQAETGAQVRVAQLPAGAATDAFLDERARELVRAARARRSMVDMRIRAYEVTAVERLSVGVRAVLGERLLLRRETASRIEWTPDTVRVHVLGAREVLPVVRPDVQVPGDLSGYMPALAFDPVDSEMLLRMDTTGIRNPLAAGSEAHYRYATGDSTVIRLPDGREVRLRELRILPRRRDPSLMNGSLWIDAETHAVVQSYFRLARPYDSRRDGRRRRGLLQPTVQAELDYVAIDYGLWDLQWWLPRTIAVRGMIQAAGLRLPMSYERRYDGYIVAGDAAVALLDRADHDEPRLCRPRTRFVVNAGAGARDTARAREAEARRQARADSARTARGGDGAAARDTCDRPFMVTKEPVERLAASELLPADIYDGAAGVIEPGELAAIAARVRGIASAPWQLERPILQWGPGGPGLLRYNRVEGLSVGARAIMDLGAAEADAELRLGTAGGALGAEAGVTRPGTAVQARVGGYHRLDVLDVGGTPFSPAASAAALLLGSDDHDYFRATGGELLLQPAKLRPQWWDVRLFAERQAPVAARSDFSIAGLLDGERGVRPNITAEPATQFGAALRLRAAGGADPARFRWGGEVEILGEAGDFQLVRPAARLRTTLPLAGRVSLGTELAAGAGFGEVTPQRLWQLGDASTLRGYGGAAVRGDAYWRGRAELGLGLPLARVALFGDAAMAAPRAELFDTRPLRAVGVGVSVLDGMLRLDVARALDAPRGWRLHLQLDSLL